MKEREKEKSVREDGEGWGCDERERERPDRALSAARPWLDPRINMLVCEVAFLFLFILFTLSVVIFLM